MIYFTVNEWKLGLLIAAHTEKGLHAILLGTNQEALVAALYKKFPEAEKVFEDHPLHNSIQEFVRTGVYEGYLDIKGTDFQKDVWKILKAIPRGKTMSYAAVAEKLGRDKAYRAVAQACAANELPLVIPCHRVVGKKGLGGYRYGVALKDQLLQEERL